MTCEWAEGQLRDGRIDVPIWNTPVQIVLKRGGAQAYVSGQAYHLARTTKKHDIICE